MIVTARRASAILFNLLRQRADARPLLLPANVCPVVPLALLEAGQALRLVDIEEGGAGMDRDSCLQLLQTEPGAYAGVLYVRPYGAVRDVSAFFRAARSIAADLLLIDDRCLCRPVPDQPSPGSEVDVTLYSTGSRKPVDLGGGGFAFLREGMRYAPRATAFDRRAEEAAEASSRAAASGRPLAAAPRHWLDTRPHGRSWEDYATDILEARRVADDHRAKLNDIYRRGLPPEIQLPADSHDWRFQIRVPAPARLLARFRRAGLFASRHYASLGRGILCRGTFPRAEELAARIVNLFNDRNYDEHQARCTVEIVRRHLDGHAPAVQDDGPAGAHRVLPRSR